jgi:hypothetical protein
VIDAVLIVAEPTPSKRANKKFGVVCLDFAPGVPKELLFGEEA